MPLTKETKANQTNGNANSFVQDFEFGMPSSIPATITIPLRWMNWMIWFSKTSTGYQSGGSMDTLFYTNPGLALG